MSDTFTPPGPLTTSTSASRSCASALTRVVPRPPFAEAAAVAARTCDWPDERAAREVLAVAADPTLVMYALGKLRIREWRAAVSPASRPSLKAFHDRLLRCGNAPLATVWRYYLDGQAGGTMAGANGATTNTEVS